jgi:hypothetical protein
MCRRDPRPPSRAAWRGCRLGVSVNPSPPRPTPPPPHPTPPHPPPPHAMPDPLRLGATARRLPSLYEHYRAHAHTHTWRTHAHARPRTHLLGREDLQERAAVLVEEDLRHVQGLTLGAPKAARIFRARAHTRSIHARAHKLTHLYEAMSQQGGRNVGGWMGGSRRVRNEGGGGKGSD